MFLFGLAFFLVLVYFVCLFWLVAFVVGFFFKVLVERTQEFVGQWEKSILEAWPGTRATG